MTPRSLAAIVPEAGVREVAGSASLLLLVGGLSMLSLIVVLVVLQGFFPDRPAALPMRARRLRPLQEPEAAPQPSPERHPGRRARRGAPSPVKLPVDAALDRALASGVGEPRLLRSLEHYSLVRVYGCADCADGPAPVGACPRTLAGLEDAFRAVRGPGAAVREKRCARRGDAACEFEVTH